MINGITLINDKAYYVNGKIAITKPASADVKKTIAYSILSSHNSGDNKALKIKFDALASHDITYVGIIQTAKASGLSEFPIPYVLTNCHNSLCAVGGTINEDDHVFGLSCAKKFGGIYVPASFAVIHTFMREMFAGCGKMILGSDSHTRYGALGTMAIGEGGPELVKQLLKRTYDISYPKVIGIELKGKPRKGVGPMDVALSIIGSVYESGFVKNAVLEFFGEGVYSLPIEYRNGIDVMTTESACLSSIWETDEKVQAYLKEFGRAKDYKKLQPKDGAEYDKAIIVDLDKVEPMIALPFHPSNVYTLREVIGNPMGVFTEVEKKGTELLKLKDGEFKLTDKIIDGKIQVNQAVIAGCAGGTYDNIATAANILKGSNIGNGAFTLTVYRGSEPTLLSLIKGGSISNLIQSGAVIKPCFCGPCFGAGDVPCNNGLSIRHTTRNFERREGSKPVDGQIASVALMDARSIAATAKNGGVLTSALGMDFEEDFDAFEFDPTIYENRVYNGYKKGDFSQKLQYGPNITDIPKIEELKDNLLLKVCSVIKDPVTTTDELIPSGETSSYRSNPLRLAEFALSRKDSGYVKRSKDVRDNKDCILSSEMFKSLKIDDNKVSIGSVVFANKPGDGSAREQAASCQRFLGAGANIAREYATKRYRSNLINWGMVPFINDKDEFEIGDYILVKDIKSKLEKGLSSFAATIIYKDQENESKLKTKDIELKIDPLTDDERQIILDGCLINYYGRGR